MTRLVRAELFKLRTTSMWWLFAGATLISTAVMLVVDIVQAHSLLKPFDQYVNLETHGNGSRIPPEFLAHLQSDWSLGHNVITQAATVYTAGQLIGVLLACLLGIVLITSEYHQQTATTTFLWTPHRIGWSAASSSPRFSWQRWPGWCRACSASSRVRCSCTSRGTAPSSANGA